MYMMNNILTFLQQHIAWVLLALFILGWLFSAKIKGNFTDEVFTTALFYTSIKHLENSLLSKNVDVNIYNLSSHGAFFENTIPKEINTINIDSFKEINIKKNKLRLQNENKEKARRMEVF